MPSRRTRPRTSSRTSRPYLRSWRPNVETWLPVAWKLPWAWVVRASIAWRRSSGPRPGKVVQPVPIASAAWASLSPIAASPYSAANRAHAGVARSPERRRVERLDPVGMEARIRLGQEPAEHEPLGAQRIRDERVGRDRQPAVLVDLGDRRPERAQGLDRLVDEQRQEVPAAGRDLLADDDLEPQPSIARRSSGRPAPHRSARDR